MRLWYTHLAVYITVAFLCVFGGLNGHGQSEKRKA